MLSLCAHCLQYKAKRNALYDPDASDEEDSIKASKSKSKKQGMQKEEAVPEKAATKLKNQKSKSR